MVGEKKYLIVLPLAAGDEKLAFRKPWPFDHPPGTGEHVGVPIPGWTGPQRVAIRKVTWEPDSTWVGGTMSIVLHQQRHLAANPTRDEAVAFYTEKGWELWDSPQLD